MQKARGMIGITSSFTLTEPGCEETRGGGGRGIIENMSMGITSGRRRGRNLMRCIEIRGR
jgi:hypothetical protein